VGSLV